MQSTLHTAVQPFPQRRASVSLRNHTPLHTCPVLTWPSRLLRPQGQGKMLTDVWRGKAFTCTLGGGRQCARQGREGQTMHQSAARSQSSKQWCAFPDLWSLLISVGRSRKTRGKYQPPTNSLYLKRVPDCTQIPYCEVTVAQPHPDPLTLSPAAVRSPKPHALPPLSRLSSAVTDSSSGALDPVPSHRLRDICP